MIRGNPPIDSNQFMEGKLSNTHPLLDVCDWYCSILNQNSILEENVRKIADVHNTRNVDQFKWKSWSLRPVAICNVLNTEKWRNTTIIQWLWQTYISAMKSEEHRDIDVTNAARWSTQIESTWVKEDSS